MPLVSGQLLLARVRELDFQDFRQSGFHICTGILFDRRFVATESTDVVVDVLSGGRVDMSGDVPIGWSLVANVYVQFAETTVRQNGADLLDVARDSLTHLSVVAHEKGKGAVSRFGDDFIPVCDKLDAVAIGRFSRIHPTGSVHKLGTGVIDERLDKVSTVAEFSLCHWYSRRVCPFLLHCRAGYNLRVAIRCDEPCHN